MKYRTVYDVHITLEISLSKYIIVFLGKEVARMMFLFRCKKKKKKMPVVDIAATLQFRNDCARSCNGTLSSSFVGYVNLWLRIRSLLYTRIFSRSQQEPSMSNSFHHVPGTGGFFIFIFYIFVFYKNIFSIWKFTGIYPGRPAAGWQGLL